MKQLADRRHKVDVQVLDNEVSAEYKSVITEDWQAKFQSVLPNVHQRNVAKRAIRTFKAHFYRFLLALIQIFQNICGTNSWSKRSWRSTY